MSLSALASNRKQADQEERMSFCELDPLQAKIQQLCSEHSMTSFSPLVLRLLAMACEQRVREIIDKAVVISGHRNELFKGKLMNVKRGALDIRRAIRLIEANDKVGRND